MNARVRDRHLDVYRMSMNYVDYVYYGDCPQWGYVVNDIMELPKNDTAFPGHRQSDIVYVKAIHYRVSFTRISGAKATARVIAAVDNRNDRSYNPVSKAICRVIPLNIFIVNKVFGFHLFTNVKY